MSQTMARGSEDFILWMSRKATVVTHFRVLANAMAAIRTQRGIYYPYLEC